MAILARSRSISETKGGRVVEMPMIASDIIYRGSFVNLASGVAQPANVATGQIVGVCWEDCDNSAGAAGAKSVKVFTDGLIKHALSGVTSASTGAVAYATASNDDTLTLTTTGNNKAGVIVSVPEVGTCWVKLEAPGIVLP